MYITEKGAHPLDQELRALLLSYVAIQGSECSSLDVCRDCKLNGARGCLIEQIYINLRELFKAVVL